MNNQGKKVNRLAQLLGLPEDAELRFDPKDNTLLSSRLVDDNGNVNVFGIIVDKNAPFLRQRVNGNERILY